MRFSQRKGIQSVEVPIQIESIDNGLRNGLWTAVSLCFLDNVHVHYSDGRIDRCSHEFVFKRLWHHYFKKPIDECPYYLEKLVSYIRDYFFQCEWYEIYDFIESLIDSFDDSDDKIVKALISFMNSVMERDNCGYRIVDEKVTELTDETTKQTIENAVNQIRFSGASEHIKTAIGFLYDRSSPNYRNAIKESISGVESACIEFTGDSKATLGKAVKKLEETGHLHPAMKDALSKLYGYTSDESGIRHAIIDHTNATKDDAAFMISVCSAYINYLVLKSI